MATRTGSVKRRGARVGRTAGDHGVAFAPGDVLQFAPNFSVYVLPPDVVCLYSEDRKFFLHGELYCALASAMEKRAKLRAISSASWAEIFRPTTLKKAQAADRPPLCPSCFALLRRAPSPAIGRASACRLTSPKRTCRNCRVRIKSIDVKGTRSNRGRTERLGVRVVKRSPDLTVTLVNDYLERTTCRTEPAACVGPTPWLLVQPSGVFPLVGPVFTPGKSACWTCLADRMITQPGGEGISRSRPARPVAVSALAVTRSDKLASSLPRSKSRKRSPPAFAPICAIILSASICPAPTIAKHYVARRPQCPTCGSKKLRDPRRAPTPIELGPGAKLVMTSGGYRTVSSRATVARFRKHVSPLTGVVKRLERIDADCCRMNTNYFAGHNFSAPAMSVDELRMGLIGGSFGKGTTAEQGEASALMEAIERYSGIFQGDEIRIVAALHRFRAGRRHPSEQRPCSSATRSSRRGERCRG